MARKKKYTEPIAVRYIGDGSRYVIGIPTDPAAVTEVPADRAQGILDTGLFELVSGTLPAPPDEATDTAEEETPA